MDEQAVQALTRQLKIIKLLLGFFFVMFLAMLAILGFITYKVVTFTQDVSTKINNLETTTRQSLDVKSKICDNKSLTSVLGNSNICE